MSDKVTVIMVEKYSKQFFSNFQYTWPISANHTKIYFTLYHVFGLLSVINKGYITTYSLSVMWKILGLIRQLYECWKIDTMKILFIALVRPHASALQQRGLEPQAAKNICAIEETRTQTEPVAVTSSELWTAGMASLSVQNITFSELLQCFTG